MSSPGDSRPESRDGSPFQAPQIPSIGWAQSILESTKQEQRKQPWKEEFGVPTCTEPDANDWISHPAVFENSTNGQAG
jgi:hypothetical protein